MQGLNQDLKEKRFAPMYLLYGEESYLKKQYKEKLTQGILPDGNEMNYSFFEGKQISLPKVAEIAETLPFFSEVRLIVVENSGVFKKSSADWFSCLEGLPETTKVIFVEEEVDKRGRLYKKVAKEGRVVELKRQEGEILQRWILFLLNKEGKKITKSALHRLLEKTGNDMEALSHEVEKLISYKGKDSEIEVSDIEDIVSWNLEDKVFSMVEALANRNRKLALFYYRDLLGLKIPPMKILSVINGQFKRIYEAKHLWEDGMDKKGLATVLGIPPFAVEKVLKQGKCYTKKRLQEILREGLELEEQVKTGQFVDRLGVEIFIVKHSGA